LQRLQDLRLVVNAQNARPRGSRTAGSERR
jgi:hypothetical protein